MRALIFAILLSGFSVATQAASGTKSVVIWESGNYAADQRSNSGLLDPDPLWTSPGRSNSGLFDEGLWTSPGRSNSGLLEWDGLWTSPGKH